MRRVEIKYPAWIPGHVLDRLRSYRVLNCEIKGPIEGKSIRNIEGEVRVIGTFFTEKGIHSDADMQLEEKRELGV